MTTDVIDKIQLGGYELICEIGHGNTGKVFYAIQESLKRAVALKVLSEELARDKSYVDMFFHEAQTVAQLSHPNIIRAYDVGHADSDHFYFSMELVEGEDVSMKIKEHGKLPWRQSLEWLKKIAEALDYGVRTRALTHGDIKPANIVITHKGEVKLADLGLACLGGEVKNQDIMLTPYYAAPEVINGTWQVGDFRADIYSFGPTLYHMLSGKPVFEGNDYRLILQQHLGKAVIDVGVYAKMPAAVSEFVSKLLEKSPQNRFANWGEIIAEIEALLAGRSKAGKKKSYSLDKKRRARALQRLKARKKKSKVFTYYSYSMVAVALLFFISDWAVTLNGGSGVWRYLELFVKAISGVTS